MVRILEDAAERAERVARRVYLDVIRPRLPQRLYSFNGVRTPKKAFDGVSPWVPGDVPHFESALVEGLRKVCRPGDQVVVVGGGRGVTMTVASQQVGEEGKVTAFEPDAERHRLARATAEANPTPSEIEVVRGLVAGRANIDVDADGADVVPVEDLPDCDVLEIDCEGLEVEILETMTIRPRAILVESHGHLGAPTSEVHRALEEIGYTVDGCQVAEVHKREQCEEQDVMVTRATREAAPDDGGDGA